MDRLHSNSTANFDFRFSPGKVLHSLIFFTILFPFVPALIPSTDTQPTFLLLFLCSIFYLIVKVQYQKNYYHLSYGKLGMLFSLLGLIFFSVLVARLHIDQPTLWARIISMLQFSFALFFAYTTTYFLKDKHLKTTIIIFAVFSIVFFLTQGMLERILMPGRTDSFEVLQKSGRGARTLSPEPSFFALHILNLYIIYCFVATTEFKKRNGAIVFWLVSFCLMISFSGYGFVIFLILLALRYTKTAMIFTLLLLVASGFMVSYLESFQSFRGFRLLAIVLANDPSVLLQDASFSSRFGSFFVYLQNIRDNFILGDGFTLLQGGGFVSIVSSLGILAACFLIFVIREILILKGSNWKIKFLLIFWFLINLFSGPIGVPTLGVIIGLTIRRNHAPKHLQLALNERRTA